jgi:hypothetical protein
MDGRENRSCGTLHADVAKRKPGVGNLDINRSENDERLCDADSLYTILI